MADCPLSVAAKTHYSGAGGLYKSEGDPKFTACRIKRRLAPSPALMLDNPS